MAAPADHSREDNASTRGLSARGSKVIVAGCMLKSPSFPTAAGVAKESGDTVEAGVASAAAAAGVAAGVPPPLEPAEPAATAFLAAIFAFFRLFNSPSGHR
mmetsp:Transcript_46130/g.128554  ORF Transcript_46130/g.128554 Transcript_46130/m.128554 type:complete len:101 (+) Transcript_46130:45-347(+)